MHRALRRLPWLLPCILLLSILCTSMPSLSASAHAASAPKPVPQPAVKDLDPPLSEMRVQGTKELVHLRRDRWHDKTIVIRLSEQRVYAYDNGRQVFRAGVTTGRPSLATPVGNYYVMAKYHPTRFYSPWPSWSHNWYPPTDIDYALLFRGGGFFLHDAWWRTVFGPGTNRWHHDP